MVKFWNIQRTCNFRIINLLKYTNVESAVILNTKKVFLHEHTLSDVYTTRLVALLVMRCSKPCQTYHNVVNFFIQTRCWISTQIL